MSGANYKYVLKADSGYKSENTGKISPERHGIVCAVLAGFLGDNLEILSAAEDLLAALEAIVSIADRDTDELNNARAAIAKAKGL
jgi:hypothetical protein